MRALRQDYKEFTEGKDGSTMSALQEKFELLNGKKEKIRSLRDKERSRHDRAKSILSQFYDGFQTVTDSLGVFRSVKVPLVKSSNVTVEANKSSNEDKAGPAREKKGKISIGANNIMHLMGKLEMHATDLANRYLNHNARLKMEEEEARLHPQVRTDLLGGHKKRKTRHIKRQSIWGPSEEKRFEFTASPIHISKTSSGKTRTCITRSKSR